MLDFLNSYDWEEVFGEGSGGNCDKVTQRVPPGADISDAAFDREDVEHIISAVEGENEGASWTGVFLLKDGRFAVAEGSCDYTGWDCQAGNSMCVAPTLKDAIALGVAPEDRTRLFHNCSLGVS